MPIQKKFADFEVIEVRSFTTYGPNRSSTYFEIYDSRSDNSNEKKNLENDFPNITFFDLSSIQENSSNGHLYESNPDNLSPRDRMFKNPGQHTRDRMLKNPDYKLEEVSPEDTQCNCNASNNQRELRELQHMEHNRLMRESMGELSNLMSAFAGFPFGGHNEDFFNFGTKFQNQLNDQEDFEYKSNEEEPLRNKFFKKSARDKIIPVKSIREEEIPSIKDNLDTENVVLFDNVFNTFQKAKNFASSMFESFNGNSEKKSGGFFDFFRPKPPEN